jgi:diguanylate cyclase (GGDEF)-like protein
VYATIGALLSAGAPVGLLAVRLAAGRATLEALDREWAADRLTYVYLMVSTGIAFACFGAVLGRSADRLSRLATRDPLTGLLNRAGLLDRLSAACRRFHRQPDPLALLLVDVDRLKQVNDTRGHRAGDQVLRQVAGVIARECRGDDAAGRWGGDEFLVLSASTTLEGALAVAARIRSALGQEDDAPSVSIGIAAAASTSAGVSVETLLAAADRALYEAKRGGRDRIAAAAD